MYRLWIFCQMKWNFIYLIKKIQSMIFKVKKYKFEPTVINIDFNKAEIISIIKAYINTKINIWYYHLMKTFLKHLPKIRLIIKFYNIKQKIS